MFVRAGLKISDPAQDFTLKRNQQLKKQLKIYKIGNKIAVSYLPTAVSM